MALRRCYDRPMNRLWHWLKNTIETRPITFVIVGGILVYFLALVLAVLLLATVRYTGIVIAPFLSGFLVVGFHWFVARYERKSRLAQVLAIIPAGLFAFLCILGAHTLVNMQICWKNPDTSELECKIP